jgi:hypothetical protein
MLSRAQSDSPVALRGKKKKKKKQAKKHDLTKILA